MTYKVTQKEIKQTAKLYGAICVDRMTHQELCELRPQLRGEAYSIGVYGVNGHLWYNTTNNKYYYTACRSSALFVLM